MNNMEEEEVNVDDVNQCCPLFGCSSLSSGNRYYLPNRNDYIITYCRKTTSKDSIPLFVDNVWPGSVVLADYLCDTYQDDKVLENMCSIELGAGSALPSLVLSRLGIKSAVITDYPGENVIENINELIDKNNLLVCDSNNIITKPLIWGSNVSEFLDDNKNGFDIVLVAECLWKDTYNLHNELLTSIKSLISQHGVALVSFAHRPSLTDTNKHTKEHDLHFFTLAKEYGLKEEKILTCNKYKDVLEEEFVEVHLYALRKK